MSNIGHGDRTSPRMGFQLKYFEQSMRQAEGAEPNVLNIGCSADPVGLGDGARHFDIDDWSKHHKYFTQGDAHALPFPDKTYSLVIMGDILEHLVDPNQAISEALRVCSEVFVMTVFEEWRLSGHGQHIEEGQELGNTLDAEHGGYVHHHNEVYPDVNVFDEHAVPHLIHINQFNDEDILGFTIFIMNQGFAPLEVLKQFEVEHQGHRIFNWLMAFRRAVA